jgi:hypothetical protein
LEQSKRLVREAIAAGQSLHSERIIADPNKAFPDSNRNIGSSGLLQGGSGTQLSLTQQGPRSTGCNTQRAVGRARPTASAGLASWPATAGFAVTAGGGGSA